MRPSAPSVEPADDGLFPAARASADVTAEVLASSVSRAQRKRAQRLAVTDDTVATVLGALLAAPSFRLPQAAVAAAAGIPEFRLALGKTFFARWVEERRNSAVWRSPAGT